MKDSDPLTTCGTCGKPLSDCNCSRTDDEAKGAANELGLEEEEEENPDPKK